MYVFNLISLYNMSIFVYINDLRIAIEAAKQGVTVGEDTVSGLVFAGDFVGVSETPEG